MVSAPASQIHIVHLVRAGTGHGGMEQGIVNVTAAIPAEKYRFSICALDQEQTFTQRVRRADMQCYALPNPGKGVYWSYVPQLTRFFRQTGADMIHSHCWGTFLYAVLAARLAGIPIIHGEHGKNFYELNEHNRVKDWTKRLLGPRVDTLLTVSDALRREWIEQFGFPAGKVVHIPNGVDSRRFAPRTASAGRLRRELGLPEETFLIGSVGRLDPIKDYPLLLRSAARLLPETPVAVVIAGEGPEKENLLQEARRLGIADRFFLPGHLRAVEDLMNSLDVFVLPSISEGMSNVVLEAMSSGLPVICRYLPCHGEIIRSGHDGILLSPCDEASLSAELRSFAQSDARRKEFSVNARKTITDRFSLDVMVDAHDRLYQQVWDSRKPR